MRRRLIPFATMLLLSLLVGATPAAATTDPPVAVQVPCGGDSAGTGADIKAAVLTVEVSPPGSSVELEAGCVYTFEKAVGDTTPFIDITAPVTVNGHGATLTRPATTEHFVLLNVSSGGSLDLS